MSKHDLAARPIYHHKRESIDAHLTIVFAALAVSRLVEERTGWSIRTLRAHRPPLPHRPDPRRPAAPHRRGPTARRSPRGTRGNPLDQPGALNLARVGSSPTRRHTSARARSVNDARGKISGQVSVQVLVGHNWCGHRRTRLIHTKVTGRPAVGKSRTQHGRRSCSCATAPHSGQPTRSAVVSTPCSSSPSWSDTVSTTNPGKPNIAAAALRSRSTWGLHLRVLDTTDHEAPGPFPGPG